MHYTAEACRSHAWQSRCTALHSSQEHFADQYGGHNADVPSGLGLSAHGELLPPEDGQAAQVGSVSSPCSYASGVNSRSQQGAHTLRAPVLAVLNSASVSSAGLLLPLACAGIPAAVAAGELAAADVVADGGIGACGLLRSAKSVATDAIAVNAALHHVPTEVGQPRCPILSWP